MLLDIVVSLSFFTFSFPGGNSLTLKSKFVGIPLKFLILKKISAGVLTFKFLIEILVNLYLASSLISLSETFKTVFALFVFRNPVLAKLCSLWVLCAFVESITWLFNLSKYSKLSGVNK